MEMWDNMLKIGMILENKYEISDILGSGGGGTVYKAYQKGLNRYVAIKEIKDSVTGILCNSMEADILKQLKHTYIPSVHDFIPVDAPKYMVMDFVDGKSVKEYLDHGKRFSKSEILKYTRQLCEAVVYLHSQKVPIIHSDIKPANIMLTNEGNICLIDFNISLFVDGNENAIGVSDGYSPPEQYSSGMVKVGADELDATLLDTDDATATLMDIPDAEVKTRKKDISSLAAPNPVKRIYAGKVDVRSDIYSMGATIYHMATGVKPKRATEENVPVEKLNSGLSDSFAAIIDKAMKKDPAERFQTARQLFNAVNNLQRFDKRYNDKLVRQEIAAALVILAMSGSLVTAALGYKEMNNDSISKYDSYVSNISEENIDEAESCFLNAVNIQPERAEAYEKMASAFYDSGRYADAVGFINDALSKGTLYTENGEVYVPDKLYYILGRGYMEIGEYDKAADTLKYAVELNDKNSDYLCDYAVVLAYCGRSDESEKMLKEAEKMGVSDHAHLFVLGEIEYASGNYIDSIKDLTECISGSNDPEIVYRAYIICGNAYKEAYANGNADGEVRIDFLNKALNAAAPEKSMPFYEMLGEAYIDEAQKTGEHSYYEKAISVYKKMNSMGWETLSSDCVIIRAYRYLGKYEEAKSFALNAVEQNSGEYTLYKLLAYVESDIQKNVKKDQRDYSDFSEYFNKAKELCTDSEDFEMQRLEEAYEQLKKEGYINE